MNIKKWLRHSISRINRDGISGIRVSMRPVYNKILEQGTRFQPTGENIYDFDWDLLIIVDACRLDLMKEVSDRYDFIEEIDSIWSVESTTKEWMNKTFTEEYSEISADTRYICGNPFSSIVLFSEDFAVLDEVWQQEWMDIGTVPPRAVTNRTIAAARENNTSRIIAHYMQPHCPFIPHPELMASKDLKKWGNQDTRDVWERLRAEELSEKEVWNGYRDNLEYVLEDVKLLLNNIDAEKVVITSDHGNAMGEWMVYGHPPGSPLRCLREVPWITTSASDTSSYEPTFEDISDVTVDREDQLQALGYVN